MRKLLVLALLAGCASVHPTRVTELVRVQRVEHIDLVAREPMLVEHPDGTLFVAGYGTPHPTLWKSGDHGATWSRVDVGPDAAGNSDVDLAVAPDGTLYFVSMLYDREKDEGVQIAVGASRDAGASWQWTTVSKTRFDDRPWIEVAPDGTAHLIWNDGSGVSHVTSRDRGATWSARTRIDDHGGSSHLAIGPKGELAARITPLSASGNKYDEGLDLIAISTDGGATWSKHAAPGERDWNPDFESDATPRWVEPLAWDARGNLYSFWADKRGVSLARSSDRGQTWTTWRVLDMPQMSFFPYLVARGEGDLAATWFTASSETGPDLQWHLARIDASGEAQPRITVAEPQPADSKRVDKKDNSEHNDPAGEYLPVAFLRDGTLAVVSPIQHSSANRMGFTYWVFESR
ncbi:MAG TPA: sialidase family protein [Thermoanaerobaculia bacterium]|nr:sialidase family protein [Thermoanaerobaculia bacterium]